MKFRICENKDGFYKIQQISPAIIVFGIQLRKEKWVDAYIHIYPYKYEVEIKETFVEAHETIAFLKMLHARKDKNWKCSKIL